MIYIMETVYPALFLMRLLLGSPGSFEGARRLTRFVDASFTVRRCEQAPRLGHIRISIDWVLNGSVISCHCACGPLGRYALIRYALDH